MKTEQEEFWQGNFGDEYIDRNKSAALLASNISFFSKIFNRTGKINSIMEFGCNIGMNLKAIRALLPESSLSGIDINKRAVDDLNKWEGGAHVIEDSILDIELDTRFDLTLIKAVLIHINPEKLNDIYARLYNFSDKYICIAEYYNPAPVTISYRGHDNRLFKRDFAGELMSKYPDLELVDYGFIYKNDPIFPQDDITWFLMKKS
jgi:pseudaminic acid biosynthesis-associated methylase